MGLHVNRNLALEMPTAVSLPVGTEAVARDLRAELAAQFVPAGARVLELGRNPALQPLTPHGCIYTARDLAGEFPTKAAAQADIIVILGALEGVADADSLFTHLRFCRRDVVLSYHPTDFGEKKSQIRGRTAFGFVNHYSFYDLALLFDRHGFRIECTTPVDERQMLMRLTPTERLKPVAPCSVAVISGSDAGDLGSRLGYHMINALLPGEAEVHHLTFATLDRARAKYDLVVLGTGNSLFQPLIGEEVLDIVSRARAAIGIFGTQYRELLPRASLDRLLDRLDIWFARYEDDALLYGRGRRNVVHLGDWLIDQFPLATPSLDDPLQIDAEIASELPLDRTIQMIQQHRQVYSARLAPLLCALTSAELAAYAEQPSAGSPRIVSGKFRSMLIDIFGRTYAEKKFFMVDRDAVTRYKARVHGNVAKVARRIDAILRDVAAATI
ncbi:MAG TPA: hypothetical protein VMI47_08570 [Pseudolabrys sp.]|nr:hypothetical protein [Pseudolabrys sp.]